MIAGGDVRGLGLASVAISHGRVAAETVHARLRGLPVPETRERDGDSPRVHASVYDEREPRHPIRRSAAERLASPEAEVTVTLDTDAFAEEASRCLSCGSCFGCERCMMYCNPGGFTRLGEVAPGAYFALDLDRCEGCGKCIEVCPSGALDVR